MNKLYKIVFNYIVYIDSNRPLNNREKRTAYLQTEKKRT